MGYLVHFAFSGIQNRNSALRDGKENAPVIMGTETSMGIPIRVYGPSAGINTAGTKEARERIAKRALAELLKSEEDLCKLLGGDVDNPVSGYAWVEGESTPFHVVTTGPNGERIEGQKAKAFYGGVTFRKPSDAELEEAKEVSKTRITGELAEMATYNAALLAQNGTFDPNRLAPAQRNQGSIMASAMVAAQAAKAAAKAAEPAKSAK
jgi:hypothetical protein